MKTREQISKFIKDNYKGRTDLQYFLNEDIYESIDEIRSEVEDNLNVEIIYYWNAIEYLMENDPSLNESMRIADEFGYTPENLNSEVLASLLASENEREIWYEFESELEDFINE